MAVLMMSRGIFPTIKLFVQGATETNSQQLPCLEAFKQEINCVCPEGF